MIKRIISFFSSQVLSLQAHYKHRQTLTEIYVKVSKSETQVNRNSCTKNCIRNEYRNTYRFQKKSILNEITNG